MCLTAGERDQTTKCLNLDYIKISSDKVVFSLAETLETSWPGHHIPHIEIKTFQDTEHFIVADLKQYIKMTNQLLLSFLQPHKPIPVTNF